MFLKKEGGTSSSEPVSMKAESEIPPVKIMISKLFFGLLEDIGPMVSLSILGTFS
jgi:hypothetical protein